MNVDPLEFDVNQQSQRCIFPRTHNIYGTDIILHDVPGVS